MKQERRKKTTPTAAKPSQSEPFSFGSGPTYANADEYASKALTFDILAIAFEAGRGFEGRDRWALTVKQQDRDPEILTPGSNPKRDEQLRGAQAHLEGGGSLKGKRLRCSGNAYYLVDGTL